MSIAARCIVCGKQSGYRFWPKQGVDYTNFYNNYKCNECRDESKQDKI